MAIPEWIEVVGKLGSVSVAAAVFVMNFNQNRWQNRVSARAAKVEDEKFRLALLDRRLAAIEALREVNSRYHSLGYIDLEMAERARDALRIAQVVFDDEHEEAVKALLVRMNLWLLYQRHSTIGGEAQREEHLQKLADMESAVLVDLENLLATLLQGTKVRTVEALPTRPWFRP